MQKTNIKSCVLQYIQVELKRDAIIFMGSNHVVLDRQELFRDC